MKAKPHDLMLFFNGSWAVYRHYPSRKQARAGLRYWRDKYSWPLSIKIKD